MGRLKSERDAIRVGKTPSTIGSILRNFGSVLYHQSIGGSQPKADMLIPQVAGNADFRGTRNVEWDLDRHSNPAHKRARAAIGLAVFILSTEDKC